jgi:hypothetical protein
MYIYIVGWNKNYIQDARYMNNNNSSRVRRTVGDLFFLILHGIKCLSVCRA